MRRQGILLIHGIMGSPLEFEPLAGVLDALGYATRRVTLPGHGPNPEHVLHDLTAEDIIGHCLEEHEALSREVDETFIVGHSLGGICTLLTASEQPQKLRGVSVFSTPYEHTYLYSHPHLYLKLPVSNLLPGLRYVPECATGFHRPALPPQKFPKMLRETMGILSNLRKRLHRVEVPVCLAHSIYDMSIPYQEMDKIANNVGNPDQVITHTLDQCGHQIFPFSRENDRATQIVTEFLDGFSDN